MATIDICNIDNYSDYLGNWSYIQGSVAEKKIGTWLNSTGSSFTITAVTIRCASGNGTFNQSATLTGTGLAFPLQLHLGVSLKDLNMVYTETKTITAKCTPYTTGGKQAINPSQLVETTFNLNSPLTIADGSSITIWVDINSTTLNKDDIVICAGASKWGCATSTGNSAWIWPKVVGGAGNMYIKTSNGWKLGIPYVKTSNGWKQGIAYVKTSNGWKTL